MKKAIVLSSGGVDSTTCVSVAVNELGAENVMSVSVYYGQKHFKELNCAEEIAKYYNIKHKVIDLSKTGIMDGSNCSLLQGSTQEITHGSYAEQIEKTGSDIVSTYVPFRNGLMLSAIAALAMATYPECEVDIYLGAHADDVAGDAYADCSEAFTKAMGEAIALGTYNKVHLKAPFVNLNKAGVVKTGLKFGTPYELTWSCYEGEEKPCGVCGTCIDRIKAFEINGVVDPLMERRAK